MAGGRTALQGPRDCKLPSHQVCWSCVSPCQRQDQETCPWTCHVLGLFVVYRGAEFALTHKFAIRRGAAGRLDERRGDRCDERCWECGFEASQRHTLTQSDGSRSPSHETNVVTADGSRVPPTPCQFQSRL